MDGVGGLSQKAIQPGETFKYEFTLRQHGTYMYHSHLDEMTQMALGMMGMFIIHARNPKRRAGPRLRLHAQRVVDQARHDAARPERDDGLQCPDPECPLLPGTAPMVVKTGRPRSHPHRQSSAMEHHPMHLHGYHFTVRRHRWRRHSRIRAKAGHDCAGSGRQHAHRRVHRGQSGRLGDPLPHDASRDETDGPRPAELDRDQARQPGQKGEELSSPDT